MTTTADQTERDAIVEALAHHVTTCKRIPRHHTERLTLLHGRIDALLDELELLGWDSEQAAASDA
jgi:hypothetical protein